MILFTSRHERPKITRLRDRVDVLEAFHHQVRSKHRAAWALLASQKEKFNVHAANY